MKLSVFLATTLVALTFGVQAAQAACYADYKAKIDQPLRLHYGVIEISDAACANLATAQREAEARLSVAGWTLLSIVSVFDTDGLEGRKADAGQYFLRF